MGLVGQVGFGKSGLVWYLSLGLLVLVNIALYYSHRDIRVSGGWVVVVGGGGGGRWWWCKPIIVSNPTFVELS